MKTKKLTRFLPTLTLALFVGSLTASATESTNLQQQVDQLSARLAVLEKQPSSAIPRGAIALEPYWKDGLHFSSSDHAFDIAVGGRIHLDGAVMSGDGGLRDYLAEHDLGKLENGLEVHRAQLHVKGTIYENLYAKFEYNFAQGGYLGDCYIQFNRIPLLGHILVGKASRAFGLGATPSSNYQIFMEAPVISIFGGGGMGIAIGDGIFNQRMSWAAQLYGNTSSDGLTTQAEPNLNLRLTGLPWYVDKGRNLFHLGASYKYADENDKLRYRQRPDSHIAPYFVDTGDINMSHENVLGFDSAVCVGPFSLEGEYNASYIGRKADETSPQADDAFLHGYYITAAWFLTGEYRGREYETGWGAFDSRVHPLQNFSLKDGTWGAWQVAMRYSGLMLNDGAIQGGEMALATAGINWYLNSTTRLMVNYVHAHLNGGGNANIGEARLHFEF
jgi:phosphate-selective porin OprO/OprP